MEKAKGNKRLKAQLDNTADLTRERQRPVRLRIADAPVSAKSYISWLNLSVGFDFSHPPTTIPALSPLSAFPYRRLSLTTYTPHEKRDHYQRILFGYSRCHY